MSQDGVKVLPMRSRSAMTLEEVQAAMADRAPSFDALRGGWASMDNLASNLGVIGGVPPQSAPVLEEATSELPRMLKTRFYYWDAPPPGMLKLPDYNPHATRRLAAIDMTATEIGDGQLGLLFSTRTRQTLNHRDGIVASLEKILQSQDATIRVDRTTSPMELQDTDIFLWLTVQVRDNPQIAPDLRLDHVSGISGRDASSRTADLRAGVDFTRANFLTAVAEADTLGPIDIAFIQDVEGERRSIQVKLHLDGGFEIRKNEIYFPTVLDGEDLVHSATLSLAYQIVPRLNELYIADAEKWAERRVEVIESAMVDLQERYASARRALQERMSRSPERPDEA